MSIENVTINLGPDRGIVIETGKLARLAGGSVTIRQGETVVLIAACAADPRPGLDFFPLQVDYRERFCASGMFPGGYFKREGRPTEKEILTSRMTDRPLRPLFPKGYIDDVQIMAMLLSADGENESDVLAILGASAALTVSDLPFLGPIGALRVGRIDGKFVANPIHSEMANSDLDLVYAGVAGKTIMIEGRASEISDEVLRDAFLFADAIVTRQIEAQRELAARVNKPKKPYVVHLPPDDVLRAVEEYCRGKLDAACSIVDKKQRQEALDSVSAEMVKALAPRFCATPAAEPPDFGPAFEIVTQQTVRRLILDTGKRMDGRGLEDVRPITCEVGVLPRTHGSALFSRGETQALVTTTLGSEGDAQEFDVITGGEGKKPFYLHYNFPNFSVGETGRIGGPGRREIGHGALAERSVAGMIPKDFPYTVRCVSDILGSNGSSSMASVCGASLSLMDAGVPFAQAVSGVSVGLVTGANDRKVLMVDIIGAEDHYGDMDFKVSGTRNGITGFQLDLKIPGLDIPTVYEAMQKNHRARMKILDIMEACLPKARTEMSPYAPKIFSLKINPERIGALIGPGGKVIRGITDSTGAQIDVNDDGTVNIFAANGPAMEAAKRQVMEITAEPEIGQVYRGVVKSIKEFGAFVEIIPGHEGLLHISEMADYRVNKVEDICKLGDVVTVKVIDIDERGRIRLSRKAALAESK